MAGALSKFIPSELAHSFWRAVFEYRGSGARTRMESKKIGEGTYGSVVIGVHQATNVERAIKTMSKGTSAKRMDLSCGSAFFVLLCFFLFLVCFFVCVLLFLICLKGDA